MGISVNLRRLFSFNRIVETAGDFTPIETASFVVDQDGFSNPKRVLGSELKTWLGSPASSVWLDDGTNVKTLNSRDVDLQSKGLKDTNVTTAVNLGDVSNTAFATTNKTLIGATNELVNLNVLTKEPTGFVDNNNVIVSYDETTTKITLTGNVSALFNGIIVPELVVGWESPALTDTYPTPDRAYFLYYNNGSFIWSTSPWLFTYVQIAYVYYRDTGEFIFALKESHGASQSAPSHLHGHETTGTYKASGGTLSSYTLANTVATERRPANDPVMIRDEDLTTTHGARLGENYTHANLINADKLTSDWNNAEIVKVSGNQPYWNEFTGGLWQQTLMTNNSYMSVWSISFPSAADAKSQRYNFFYLQGQSEGTLASQTSLSPLDIDLGELANISPEFVFLNQVILKYSAGNWTIEQVVDLSGTKALLVNNPSGNYLSSVVSDDTLSGLGTSASPLSVVAADSEPENIGDYGTKVFELSTPTFVDSTPNFSTSLVKYNLGATTGFKNQNALVIGFYTTGTSQSALLARAGDVTTQIKVLNTGSTADRGMPSSQNGMSIATNNSRQCFIMKNTIVVSKEQGLTARLGYSVSTASVIAADGQGDTNFFFAKDSLYFGLTNETFIGVGQSGRSGFLGVLELCVTKMYLTDEAGDKILNVEYANCEGNAIASAFNFEICVVG